MHDLSGRVAVVTGGNGGIGLGIDEGVAQAGVTIVIGARNATKNAAAVERLLKHGNRAIAMQVDLRDRTQCRALIEDTAQQFGRLDILVNNAGISFRKKPQDYTLDEWDAVMQVNLSAAFICAQ